MVNLFYLSERVKSGDSGFEDEKPPVWPKIMKMLNWKHHSMKIGAKHKKKSHYKKKLFLHRIVVGDEKFIYVL